MKKLLSSLLIAATLSASAPALADPPAIPPPPKPAAGEIDVGAAVSPMKKGQVAPFTGVLLSPRAIATVMAELDTLGDKIKLEVGHAQAVDKAQCDFSISEQKTHSDADKKVLQAQYDEANKRITILSDQLKKEEANRSNPAFYAGLGALGGVIVTVVISYAVVRATK